MATPSQPNLFAINQQQRAAVLQQAVEMTQPIFTGTFAPATQNIINIAPRNVGLLKKFIVEIKATANNTGTGTATLTDFGTSNLLSQVVFTDLNNNVRIQTPGWHLNQVAAAKNGFPLGGADALATGGSMSSYGNGFNVLQAPATIAASGNGTVQAFFEVPVCYSDSDLRGAIFANVVNATMNLQLTINPTPFVASGVDSTSAVYAGSTAGTLTNVTITVYQVYLDQLPVGQKGYILPMLDLATVYELKSTTFTGLSAGNEFPIPYANFRDFMSTTVVYNHDGSANSGRVGGTDVNYFALQSANFTNIWKKDPILCAFAVRNLLTVDMPLGVYYFDSRRKTISTTTYGNMELILNPSSAAAQAYALVGWEDFAVTNTLKTAAGSLAG